VGFKTGDQNRFGRWRKIVKFDVTTMKVIMAKEVLIVRNGTEQQLKCLMIFVDQLSKQEKSFF
jgi:regulator of sigma E protease